MQDLVVDPRFVLDDEIELRLAVRTSDRSLHVVGTRGDRLAFFDHLDEFKLPLLGAPRGLIFPLSEPGTDPAAFLASLNDKKYQNLVCQDPSELGPVVEIGLVYGPEEVYEATDLGIAKLDGDRRMAPWSRR